MSQELTQIHRDRIDAVQLKPIPGDCGDEYRKEPFLTATGDLSEHLEDANKELFNMYKFDSSNTRIGSGTFWENKFSYSRAVRTTQGQVHVAGTTATHRNTSVGNKAFCGWLSQTKDEKSGYLLQPGVYVEGESEVLYVVFERVISLFSSNSSEDSLVSPTQHLQYPSLAIISIERFHFF